MHHSHSRITTLTIDDRFRALLADLEGVLPRINTHAENAAMYFVAAVFWGVIFYVAMTSALP